MFPIGGFAWLFAQYVRFYVVGIWTAEGGRKWPRHMHITNTYIPIITYNSVRQFVASWWRLFVWLVFLWEREREKRIFGRMVHNMMTYWLKLDKTLAIHEQTEFNFEMHPSIHPHFISPSSSLFIIFCLAHFSNTLTRSLNNCYQHTWWRSLKSESLWKKKKKKKKKKWKWRRERERERESEGVEKDKKTKEKVNS